MPTRVEEARNEPERLIVERRKSAAKNLKKLQKPHSRIPTRNGFLNTILRTYEADIEELGLQEKEDLAMKHLTHDLLWQNFYDKRGNASRYGRAYLKLCPYLDLTLYSYVGLEADAFFVEMARALLDKDGVLVGGTFELVTQFVQEFSTKNEEPPIIIMPGIVVIEDDLVEFRGATSFIPPWGGGEDVVTIYKHDWAKGKWAL